MVRLSDNSAILLLRRRVELSDHCRTTRMSVVRGVKSRNLNRIRQGSGARPRRWSDNRTKVENHGRGGDRCAGGKRATEQVVGWVEERLRTGKLRLGDLPRGARAGRLLAVGTDGCRRALRARQLSRPHSLDRCCEAPARQRGSHHRRSRPPRSRSRRLGSGAARAKPKRPLPAMSAWCPPTSSTRTPPTRSTEARSWGPSAAPSSRAAGAPSHAGGESGVIRKCSLPRGDAALTTCSDRRVAIKRATIAAAAPYPTNNPPTSRGGRPYRQRSTRAAR